MCPVSRTVLVWILGIAFCSWAGAEEMQVETADGVMIHGTYYVPPSTPAPALLLVHMLRKNRDSWTDFARFAQERGFAVLVIDLRGHGQSTQSKTGPIRESAFVESDFAAMRLDVAASVQWLCRRPEVASRAISLVGASIGANVALTYAAEDSSVAALVLVSPGENYRGVHCAPPLQAYGNRPLLMVAAEDDNYSMVSVRNLERTAGSGQVRRIFADGGHGTYLFESHPELRTIIVDFVRGDGR